VEPRAYKFLGIAKWTQSNKPFKLTVGSVTALAEPGPRHHRPAAQRQIVILKSGNNA